MAADVLVITGMPRSGTTFLHRIFSGWRFPGFSSVLDKDVGRTGVSNLWKTGECPAMGKVLLDGENPMPALREMVGLWRSYVSKVYGFDKATVVYKQPQFCFTPWLDTVLADPLLKVEFVFCRREREGWLRSMGGMGPGASNNIHWKLVWGGPFDFPYEEPARLEHLYRRLDTCLKEVSQKVPGDRKTLFTFEQPEEGLRRVLDFVGIQGRKSVPHLMEKFWVRDITERRKRGLDK